MLILRPFVWQITNATSDWCQTDSYSVPSRYNKTHKTPPKINTLKNNSFVLNPHKKSTISPTLSYTFALSEALVYSVFDLKCWESLKCHAHMHSVTPPLLHPTYIYPINHYSSPPPIHASIHPFLYISTQPRLRLFHLPLIIHPIIQPFSHALTQP